MPNGFKFPWINFILHSPYETCRYKDNPGEFKTIWHALYFAIVTLSTVGYGDVTPISSWGRGITVMMILSGIALIPWQLGKLVKIMFDASRKTSIKCRKCGMIEHDMDALFCKICGTVVKKQVKNKGAIS